VEVHPDFYNRIDDFKKHAFKKLAQSKFSEIVDPIAYEMAVDLKSGVPTNVTDPGRILTRHETDKYQKSGDAAALPLQKKAIKVRELKVN
jgi:hypothetical protein